MRSRPRCNRGAECAPRPIGLCVLALAVATVAAEELRVQRGLGAFACGAQLLLEGRRQRVLRNVDPELALEFVPVPLDSARTRMMRWVDIVDSEA